MRSGNDERDSWGIMEGENGGIEKTYTSNKYPSREQHSRIHRRTSEGQNPRSYVNVDSANRDQTDKGGCGNELESIPEASASGKNRYTPWCVVYKPSRYD